ncbi:MAG: hypothetical protein ACRDL3_03940 [Solirubrobacterales bacterium]
MKRVAAVSALGALTALVAAVPASAAPVVREATGANAGAITPAVDAFEAEVGADDCPADSGCRRIVWDGVPDTRSAPAFMPEGQFRGAGALFTTPGTGVQLNMDDDSADAAPFDDPDDVDFSDIDATYEGEFEPFTQQRLFTSIGSNVIDTEFVVPDSDTPADTNAFGVVFSDVNVEGPTRMEYFAPDGSSLGSFPVPATAGSETFSFLGVIFDAGERIARVRITQGGAPLAAGVNDLGPADLVVTDNFVFGDPQEQAPPVEEPEDRAAPELDLSGVKKKLNSKKFLKGVRFNVEPNEESQIDVALVAKAKKAQLSASANGDVVLDSESFDFSTEARDGRLKPRKRLLGKAKKFKARVEVEAIDRAGNKGTETQTIKVKAKKKKKN